MTKKDLEKLLKELNLNSKGLFEVEYTTRLTNDVEYDICKHWFYKDFNTLNDAKDFFDEVSKKFYNVMLKTWKNNSLFILDSIEG